MEAWFGPAIVAAVVSGLVSAAGWFVTSWQAIRLEQRRRDEKVRDFQTALLAEIDRDFANMAVADRAEFLEAVRAQYRADPAFVPFGPRLASNVVFDVVVREIHILPGDVIRPVIDYARVRQTLERFVEDMRGEGFRSLAADRQLTMYGDYLAMTDRLQRLAEIAGAELRRSLSSSGAVPSNRGSASAPDGERDAASQQSRDEP
jgi:hypothetical protein